MTSEKLHDALNLLPADLVAETDALRTQAKKPQVHWQRWAAMAAQRCQCTWGFLAWVRRASVSATRSAGSRFSAS